MNLDHWGELKNSFSLIYFFFLVNYLYLICYIKTEQLLSYGMLGYSFVCNKWNTTTNGMQDLNRKTETKHVDLNVREEQNSYCSKCVIARRYHEPKDSLFKHADWSCQILFAKWTILLETKKLKFSRIHCVTFVKQQWSDLLICFHILNF